MCPERGQHTMGMSAAARYIRLKAATVIPQPSAAWVGRKSTFNGHSGSNHSGSRCDAE